MKRVLPFVLLLACSAPAFGQTVDSQGAKQLTDNLARYFGKKPFDIGFLKVSVEGDAYKLAFDFKPLVGTLGKTGWPEARSHALMRCWSNHAAMARGMSQADLAPEGIVRIQRTPRARKA